MHVCSLMCLSSLDYLGCIVSRVSRHPAYSNSLLQLGNRRSALSELGELLDRLLELDSLFATLNLVVPISDVDSFILHLLLADD